MLATSLATVHSMDSPCAEKELRQPSASAESLFSMTGVFGVGRVGGSPEGTLSALSAAEDQKRCASNSPGNVFGGSIETRSLSFDEDLVKMLKEGLRDSHGNSLERFEAYAATKESYQCGVNEDAARRKTMEEEKDIKGGDEEGEGGDVAAAVIDTRLAASSVLYKVPPQPQELLEAIEKVKSPGIAFDGTNRFCTFLLENSHMLGDDIDLASNMKGEAAPSLRHLRSYFVFAHPKYFL